MIKILEILATEYTATPPTPIRAALIGDTTADLPAVGDISGYTLTQGSTCHVIRDSTLYMLNSTGAWIQQLQDITADTYTRAQIDTMIAGTASASALAEEQQIRAAADQNLQTQINTKTTISDVYGLPSEDYSIPANADLNDYTNPGVYKCATNAIAATLTNCPTGNGFRLEIVSTIAASGYQQQRLFPNNSNGEFFIRRRTTGTTFSDWFRFTGTQL